MGVLGGIDLGGTKIQAVGTDGEYRVLGQARGPTPTTGGPADVVAAMLTTLREAAGDAELSAVGVGSPGAIDDDAGTVSSARNLPDWEGTYPMRDALQDELGVPVALGNDVTVATEAE